MKPFRLSREGGVATLELDRPPANVLDVASLVALTDIVRQLASGGARALGITGSPHFSAGVDVADHRPERTDAMLAAIHGFLASLLETPFPTLASVRGACLGGGAEIALCCDLVFAARDARIGFPEITLACFPPAAVLLLPGVAGAARAAEWVLSGEAISGRDAAAFGLIARAVPDHGLDDAAASFLRRVGSMSAPAVAAACRLLREPKRRAFDEGRPRSEAAYRDLLRTPDLGRAVDDFLKRRQPRSPRMNS